MNPSGVHLGLGGGYEAALEHAQALGCTSVQVFTHSPRTFAFKALEPARQQVLRDGWKRLGIHPVVSHASYLINIGSRDSKKFHGARGILRSEIEYAAAFGCQYVVFHVGKYTDGSPDESKAQIAKGLDTLSEAMDKTGVMLLLEHAAGQGTELGATFQEIRDILDLVMPQTRKHLGVCLDTCHLFASGYDIASRPKEVLDEFERTVGLDLLKVVHVNDSKFELGSRKDRHEHVGKGKIGTAGLKAFLTQPRLKGLPMLLETPIDDEGDQADDLQALRAILGQDR